MTTYAPTGKIVRFLALVAAEPMREFSGTEISEILECDPRGVPPMLGYAMRSGLVFRRKEGRRMLYRGTEYREGEVHAAPPPKKQKRGRPDHMPATGAWPTRRDDIRIPQVVPGWAPPKMTPPRGAA